MTDPDSRSIPIGSGFVQGYNAQVAVNEQKIVLAAEITTSSTDFSQLDPMVTATLQEIERAGIEQRPDAVAADAGYWNEQHMDEVVAQKHIPVLIPPDKGSRRTPSAAESGGRHAWMRACSRPNTAGSSTETQADRRAAVRQHRTQPRRQPLPTREAGSRCAPVAVMNDVPQPHQNRPPPARRRGGLNRPHRGHAVDHDRHALAGPSAVGRRCHPFTVPAATSVRASVCRRHETLANRRKRCGRPFRVGGVSASRVGGLVRRLRTGRGAGAGSPAAVVRLPRRQIASAPSRHGAGAAPSSSVDQRRRRGFGSRGRATMLRCGALQTQSPGAKADCCRECLARARVRRGVGCRANRGGGCRV